MAERFKAPVLKTGDGQPSVSSNLTASAVPTVQIVPARPSDAARAAACFAAAFASDPLMDHFFGDHPQGRAHAVEAFFHLLLRARIATAMPALLARDGDCLLGGAMGYATARTDWPVPLQREWDALESSAPDIGARFAAYDTLSAAGLPPTPHYYLGVIGVAPEAKRTGVGTALLEAFCQLSADDPLSSGVYLETANPDNLAFYARHGFELRASGALGPGTLWCLFHPHVRREAPSSAHDPSNTP